MTIHGWLQIALVLAVLLGLTPLVGGYLVRVYDGSSRWAIRLERLIYRLAGIDAEHEQHWTTYGGALLSFSVVATLLTYLMLRLQAMLPLNPADMAAVGPTQAFETAASFATNTNWQSYGGETTMSYLSQMLQLTFQNFVSAGAGMAVAVALVRGIARRDRADGIVGNFWVDLVRSVVYVLLPLSVILALLLVHQGVIQTFDAYRAVTTLEGGTQTIALGPVASQEAIKQLGTNGGGFFNANAAHPFENPTPWSNLLSLVALLLIPSAFTVVLGRMTGKPRHGWTVWVVMAAFWTVGVSSAYVAEAQGTSLLAKAGVALPASADQPGGNMEGKEVRFGISASALYAVSTTATSTGSVNAMHDSFTPLGGLVPLLMIELGEVVFGGVGVGLGGMLFFVALAVFLAGLMIGRTPTYLGKRIGQREIQVVMLGVLIFPALVLGGSALAISVPVGLAGLGNDGAHGLSEVLYAFSSTAGNNGSAFAGLSGGSAFYNVAFGLATLVGRFVPMLSMVALGGFLAEQAGGSGGEAAFPVTGPLFGLLLAGTILLLGALTFYPVLALGPIAEHLSMLAAMRN
ncbi:MAG: potassium-transporting ATPase subunit KdpA [Gemmatimonadaceae bacterium]|jgi:K+-transporting ATPase ATPase A chain|nr:potassium-transporting ATPase subunit KdpA [Gemmatimonadaceae bacterium]